MGWQILDFCIIFNTTLTVFERLSVYVQTYRYHESKNKALVQEPKAAAYPVHTRVHRVIRKFTFLNYFIKNSSCATHLTLMQVLHTWDWETWLCREQQTTFGLTAAALCWGIPALTLGIALEFPQRKSSDRMPQQHTNPVKSTNHFLTQILHRILREIVLVLAGIEIL